MNVVHKTPYACLWNYRDSLLVEVFGEGGVERGLQLLGEDLHELVALPSFLPQDEGEDGPLEEAQELQGAFGLQVFLQHWDHLCHH